MSIDSHSFYHMLSPLPHVPVNPEPIDAQRELSIITHATDNEQVHKAARTIVEEIDLQSLAIARLKQECDRLKEENGRSSAACAEAHSTIIEKNREITKYYDETLTLKREFIDARRELDKLKKDYEHASRSNRSMCTQS